MTICSSNRIIVLTLLCLGLSLASLSAQPDTILTASDPLANANLGFSVSIGENIAIVGAPGHDNESGAAYIYRYNGSAWQEEVKLTASDAAVGNKFGHTVSISANTAAVAAPYDDEFGSDAGAVYLYRWDGTNWNEQKVVASDADRGRFFGFALAAFDDIVVISTYDNGSAGFTRGGAAYVFRWDESLGWTQIQHLLAADAGSNDWFGWSVALSDDFLVVGAPQTGDYRDRIGAAYVYRWDGCFYTFMQKITAADGNADDRFGVATAVHGSTIAVGAYQDSDIEHWAGSAYVFRWDGSSWTEEQKLIDASATALRRYGSSVSVWEQRLVVGEPYAILNNQSLGAAFVYDWDGTDWQLSDTRYGLSNSAEFGLSVATHRNFTIVGANEHPVDIYPEAGIAQVFEDGSSVAFRLSDDVFFYDLAIGESISRTVTIHNTSDNLLSYSFSTIPIVSWLSFESGSGVLAAGESAEVTLLVNAVDLVAGNYKEVIHVSAGTPDIPLRDLPISLRVLHERTAPCECAADCCDIILSRLEELQQPSQVQTVPTADILKQLQELSQKMESLSGLVNSPRGQQNNPRPDQAKVRREHSLTKTSQAQLFSNRPNPFDEATTISYYLPEDVQEARLDVLSAQGALIRSFTGLNKGQGQITIHGGELSSGTYMYRLLVGGSVVGQHTMILLD